METLTLVQSKAIPVILGGKDALIKSQTGSGKTLAYAVPILHKLQVSASFTMLCNLALNRFFFCDAFDKEFKRIRAVYLM